MEQNVPPQAIDQSIAVENYKSVLAQKEEYIKLHPGEALSEKHLHDFVRAGAKPKAS